MCWKWKYKGYHWKEKKIDLNKGHQSSSQGCHSWGDCPGCSWWWWLPSQQLHLQIQTDKILKECQYLMLCQIEVLEVGRV